MAILFLNKVCLFQNIVYICIELVKLYIMKKEINVGDVFVVNVNGKPTLRYCKQVGWTLRYKETILSSCGTQYKLSDCTHIDDQPQCKLAINYDDFIKGTIVRICKNMGINSSALETGEAIHDAILNGEPGDFTAPVRGIPYPYPRVHGVPVWVRRRKTVGEWLDSFPKPRPQWPVHIDVNADL